MISRHFLLTYLVPGILLSTLALAAFLYHQTTELNATVAAVTEQRDIAQTEVRSLNETIENIQAELVILSEDYEELRDDYREERNKNEEFEDRIDNLAGTLGTLNKLAKTDKELLQKYSKVYFLNENYAPEAIRKIDDEWVLEGKEDQYFHREAMPFLEDLLEDAERDDIDLKVVSAYRSFDEQSQLKGQFTQLYGAGANAFSADQGYSEHQLGTTVDLTIESVGGTYTSFADTEAYEWLLDNAYKHGFVLSYPEGNEFYIFEPWHWRFVGEDLARDLHRDDMNFYDMDQRDIDEYLVSIFD
jgi:D-alanyl-D-alanine carboxypeptidase